MSSVAPSQRRLLTAADAASYCGVSASTFPRACPVAPVRILPGRRGLRYDVKKLDDWIDRLSDGIETKDISHTSWLEKLDA